MVRLARRQRSPLGKAGFKALNRYDSGTTKREARVMARIGSNPKQLKVDVAIRRGINNFDDPRPYRLVITDSGSRKQIGEIRMTGEEFALMLTNSEQRGVPAEFIGDDGYGYVGKEGWNVTVTIARGFDGYGYNGDVERLQTIVDAWNDTDAFGDVTFSVGARNNGLALTVRGYADSMDDAVHWAEATAATLADYVITHNLETMTGMQRYPTAESIRRDREIEELAGE